MSRHNRMLHWLVRAGFVVALALSVLFAVRTVMMAIYWNDPAHQDQTMAGWMPPGYVGRSWHVPPEVIAPVLGVEPNALPHRSLEQIASDRGIPLAVLVAQLTAAIEAYRRAHP